MIYVTTTTASRRQGQNQRGSWSTSDLVGNRFIGSARDPRPRASTQVRDGARPSGGPSAARISRERTSRLDLGVVCRKATHKSADDGFKFGAHDLALQTDKFALNAKGNDPMHRRKDRTRPRDEGLLTKCRIDLG